MLSAPSNAEAVDWVTASVRNFDGTVGSIVPAGFGAYARVFHPASRRMGTGEVEVRWAEVAAANACVMHPAAEWGSLAGSWEACEQPGLWDQSPRTGELPEAPATRLAAVLAMHTTSPECSYFALWDGVDTLGLMFSFSEGTPEEVRDASGRLSRKRSPRGASWCRAAQRSRLDREMRLLRGPLAAIEEFYAFYRHPPSLWWPEDRAWCVGTDVDLMSTYVGGSSASISAVLADDGLKDFPSGLRRPVRHLGRGHGQSAAHATMRTGANRPVPGPSARLCLGPGRFMPRDPSPTRLPFLGGAPAGRQSQRARASNQSPKTCSQDYLRGLRPSRCRSR